MNEPWRRITKGGLVTWCVKSGYYRDFKVIDIYASARFKDEWQQPAHVALLEPTDQPLFFTTMLEEEHSGGDSVIRVEVPLRLLVPVITQTLH